MSRFPRLSSVLVKSMAAALVTKIKTTAAAAAFHINAVGKFTPPFLFILLCTLLSISQRNSQLDHSGPACK